jgi:thioredoxin reductase/NAD-dependent dihydropyrimidine dehydrogenase PreA subunit
VNGLWIYGLVLLAALAWYVWRRTARQRAYVSALREAEATGLVEPPSLHPVVDPVRCIGSGSCAQACPEQALGVVGGKAVLVNASACIGHGACLTACPVEAISLVFGTERRGVEIPMLSPQFETNVPGLFIAGELGGMGLIRKAVEQGRQAVDALSKRPRGGHELDLVIVGCGPAGLSAGLAAKAHGLRYRMIEQEDSLGGAVYHYPRHKIAMTAPVELALVGTVRFGEVAKERLLEFWNDVVARTGLEIRFRERMVDIVADGDGFVVHTSAAEHRARSVLLAIGRRGTPRKLDVPGEDEPKVVYKLIDAEQYRGQSVLVVGGGDSALEAALALAEQPGTAVTLSYRGQAFSRVKPKNRQRVEAAASEGRLALRMGSNVLRVGAGDVTLESGGDTSTLRNDAVIVCAGGQLPTPLLQKIGVSFQTKYGTA